MLLKENGTPGDSAKTVALADEFKLPQSPNHSFFADKWGVTAAAADDDFVRTYQSTHAGGGDDAGPRDIEEEKKKLREAIVSSHAISAWGRKGGSTVEMFLHRAAGCAAHACGLDAVGGRAARRGEVQLQSYEEAAEWYDVAVQYIFAALKYEKGEAKRMLVRAHAMQYLDRAAELKEYLEGSDDVSVQILEAMEQLPIASKPDVEWPEAPGLAEAKAAMIQAAANMRVSIDPGSGEGAASTASGPGAPPQTLLLYGVSGWSTHLARALSTELKSATLMSVAPKDGIASLFMLDDGGEAWDPAMVQKELFNYARQTTPCILFIEDIDALCDQPGGSGASGDSLSAAFVQELNEISVENEGLLVIGSTREPWKLDEAMLARFHSRVYLPSPDAPDLEVVYKSLCATVHHNLADADFGKLAAASAGMEFTGVEAVVQQALFLPVRRIQEATHFRQTDCDASGLKEWAVCAADDEGAVAGSWQDFAEQILQEPAVTLADFEAAIAKRAPAGEEREGQLARMCAWHGEHGAGAGAASTAEAASPVALGGGVGLMCGGYKARGPAWTRGEIEKPLGEENMGTWTAAVYTEEQQARLGVDKTGAKVEGAAAAETDETVEAAESTESTESTDAPAAVGMMCGGYKTLGPAWTRGEIEKPLGEESRGTWTAAVYTEEQQARLGVDKTGAKAEGAAPGTGDAAAPAGSQ